MDNSTKLEEARVLAVDSHDQNAGYFENEYRSLDERNDYTTTAFLYGRKKIDALLYSALQRIPSGGNVLDIGCGTGDQTYRVRSLGYRVIGLEPAPQMRALAQAKNPGVEIIDGSILQLPFENQSFDFVFALEVLRYFHLPDVYKAYEELFRVLKPGGTVFFTMVNRYALDGYYIFYYLKKFALNLAGKPPSAHCEFVIPSQVMSGLKYLGGKDIQIKGRLFAPIRFFYKISDALGKTIATKLEPYDDAQSQYSWTIPFAGHLIIEAKK
jgi:ubiquinone/menaquinone biosynthesis C-methylase UbiE